MANNQTSARLAWLQAGVGSLLGLLLGVASTFPSASLFFYVGVLAGVFIWILWRRATKTARWFAFGVVLGYLVWLLFCGILLMFIFF
jgi:hypothetical protein